MSFLLSELLNPYPQAEQQRENGDLDAKSRETGAEVSSRGEAPPGDAVQEYHGHGHAQIKTEVTEQSSHILLDPDHPTQSPDGISQTLDHADDKSQPDRTSHKDDRTNSVDVEKEDTPNGSVENMDDGAKARKGSSTTKPRMKTSSKNEGQHTDRRYLCYLCNKLFTRRRSVRDHISKIHGSKTWEPSRSLEVIVDPTTGEPVEALEKERYKAAAPPRQSEEGDDMEEPEHEQPLELQSEQSPPPPSAPLPPPPTIVANLKIESSVGGSRASSVDTFATPAPIIGKKRPAPSSNSKPSAAATKKGTAKVKHIPNKKPKISNSDSPSNTPAFRSSSATPAPSSKAPLSKLKKQLSASIVASPSPAPESRGASVDVFDEDDDDEDDNENENSYSAADSPGSNDDGDIFCICRKGDNHTWMIACDGGCEEWFHGGCVNIRERDGDLIDKYICPHCEREGYVTTWKRRCRRKSCRKPARVRDIPPSKYCSPECGRKFFVEMVLRGDENVTISKNGQFVLDQVREKKLRRKRRGADGVGEKPAILRNGHTHSASRQHSPPNSDEENGHSEYETDSSADDEVLPNRGGPLRAGEVKAIAERCKTIESWRQLGKKPEVPLGIEEKTATVNGNTATATDTRAPIEFDTFEAAKISFLTAELAQCQARLDLLEAREKMLGHIKTRSGNITEEVRKANPKMKDLCGFDPRLSWTEAEFLGWWKDSSESTDALSSGNIGPPPETSAPANGANGQTGSGDDEMDDEGDGEPKMPTKGGVCIKNRCARHGKWAKMQLAELRFEQDVVGRRMERLKREEEKVRDAAVVKMWEVKG